MVMRLGALLPLLVLGAALVVAAVELSVDTVRCDLALSGNRSDFELWLKCKAVELYVCRYDAELCAALNATPPIIRIPKPLNGTPPSPVVIQLTGTPPMPRPDRDMACILIVPNGTMPCPPMPPPPRNLTIPCISMPCILPSIGVGSAVGFEVARPGDVVAVLREARGAGLGRLPELVNRTVGLVFSDLGRVGFVEAYNATVRGIRTLERVAELLVEVNASPVAVEAVRRGIMWLNYTRELLWLLRRGDEWVLDVLRKATNVAAIDEALARLDELGARVDAVSGVLSRHGVGWVVEFVRGISGWLNRTRDLLVGVRMLVEAGLGREVAEAAARGDLNRIRELITRVRERARGIGGIEVPGIPGRR